MKTKNELDDWQRVVADLERGKSLEEASKDHATVVHSRTARPAAKVSRVSLGQLKAIRRD